ncbi:MAG: Branched-chain amino acid transport system permease protein [Frankiales bacterium]|nr:Branched-chain amino acid transport system permease protein [Frankiales bacterium]
MLALQLLVNGIAVGALYALAAVGVALIFWTTRVFHIAHGATYLIAAYTFVSLHGNSVLLALVGSTLAAAVFGWGMNKFVYRPIQRSRESFFTLFVASFGTLIIVANVISLWAGSGPKALPPPFGRVQIGFLQVTWVAIIAIVVAVVFLLGLQFFLEKTETGVGLRAMADDVELVDLLGLNRRRYATVALILGSVLVVPAAILTTYVQGLTPQAGLRIATIALIVSIAGGVGSLAGAVVSAILLGVVENVSTLYVNASWGTAVGFSVLLAILVFRPSGVIPRPSAT